MAVQELSRVLPLHTPLRYIGAGHDRPARPQTAYDRYFPQVPATMELTSTAFAEGQPIPSRYSADGENISPPLLWKQKPLGTRSLAIVVEDIDAQMARRPFVHWLMYNILPDETNLPEAIAPLPQVRAYGLVHGRNSHLRLGYTGCAPARGGSVHHYHFQVFALDRILALNPGKGRSTVLKAMSPHMLAKGRLIGTYQR
jgi:Raf kinase inhibitor-like YbhB/YbcL family protein